MAEANQERKTHPIHSAPGGVEEPKELDDWVSVDLDGIVHVRSGKVELGTGVRTALAQIAAEELDVPIERIRMEMGDTGSTPDEGYTAGSRTIRTGGSSVRAACAEARAALIEAASARFGVDARHLVVSNGTISVLDDRHKSVSYQELAGGRSFNRRIAGNVRFKSPADYRVVGTSAARVDLPGKLTGAGSYVHDIRLPGMLHGRVVRPPSRGAHLLSVGAAAGTQVVRIGSFVAVVAESEAAAIQGARSVSVDWAPAPQILSMNELYDHIKGLPTSDVVITNRGDVSKAIAGTERRIEAEYRQPFQAHASIGPSCAVAMEQNGVMTVWCSSQGVYPLRAALADLLGVAAEKVHVVRAEGSGCYGHNGADDVAADAVLLARETGRPVRVQWSRGDEFAWEPNGPAMIMRLEGGVDSSGRICAWRNEVRTPSHTSRPRVGIDLIAGQLIAEKFPPPKKTFMGGDRNAPTNYKIENQQITMRWISRLPLRVSALRSLGAFANSFANESFVDELAVMVGADPVEFRLLHLQDPRSREVLTTAAKSAGWGRSLPVGEGLGVAFARYENNEAYVATVAHLRVDSESGKIQLLKIVIAHDCGLIINPDGLKNQIEGNVIQSASRALLERTTWQDSRITSRDWLSYPILRFSDVPEIEIHLINRPAEPAFGAGEPATITTAPAIANALFSASGARLREIPFLPQTVKRTMSGGSGR